MSVRKRRFLTRRGGLKSSLSQGLSHDLRALLSHLRARVVVGSSAKRINGKYWRKRLLPGARFAEVARRYGIAERVLFRWNQELAVTAPAFFSVEIGAIEITSSTCGPI